MQTSEAVSPTNLSVVMLHTLLALDINAIVSLPIKLMPVSSSLTAEKIGLIVLAELCLISGWNADPSPLYPVESMNDLIEAPDTKLMILLPGNPIPLSGSSSEV